MTGGEDTVDGSEETMEDDEDTVDGDDASDERRLFGEQRQTAVGFVASEMGVLRLDLAGDRIGGFGLVERCRATDIAAEEDTVVVGTEEDVLLDGGDTGEFVRLEFGPAVAVGIDNETVLAADPDGRIFRVDARQLTESETNWREVGQVAGPRRFDGDLLATEEGVFRVGEAFEPLGLTDVTDVSRAVSGESEPMAATAEGLFERDGDGWEQTLETPIQRISLTNETALAVTTDGTLCRCDGGSWTHISLPGDGVAVDAVAGESPYVVTEAGEFFIAADSSATTDGFEGWRSQSLGIRDVVGCVVLGQ